jgi:hypothetical protein
MREKEKFLGCEAETTMALYMLYSTHALASLGEIAAR